MEWQPIETVPNDERVIMANETEMKIIDPGQSYIWLHKPTHWMPAPDLPELEDWEKEGYCCYFFWRGKEYLMNFKDGVQDMYCLKNAPTPPIIHCPWCGEKQKIYKDLTDYETNTENDS